MKKLCGFLGVMSLFGGVLHAGLWENYRETYDQLDEVLVVDPEVLEQRIPELKTGSTVFDYLNTQPRHQTRVNWESSILLEELWYRSLIDWVKILKDTTNNGPFDAQRRWNIWDALLFGSKSCVVTPNFVFPPIISACQSADDSPESEKSKDLFSAEISVEQKTTTVSNAYGGKDDVSLAGMIHGSAELVNDALSAIPPRPNAVSQKKNFEPNTSSKDAAFACPNTGADSSPGITTTVSMPSLSFWDQTSRQTQVLKNLSTQYCQLQGSLSAVTDRVRIACENRFDRLEKKTQSQQLKDSHGHFLFDDLTANIPALERLLSAINSWQGQLESLLKAYTCAHDNIPSQ